MEELQFKYEERWKAVTSLPLRGQRSIAIERLACYWETVSADIPREKNVVDEFTSLGTHQQELT